MVDTLECSHTMRTLNLGGHILGITNAGGVPGMGFSKSGTYCVFFAWKSVIAREFLLKIGTSLAIATSGLRTNLLFEKLWRCPSTVSCTAPDGESAAFWWIPS